MPIRRCLADHRAFVSDFFCHLRRKTRTLRRPSSPMRYTDIAIIGGGLAGSTAAAMLGRAGVSALLVDPHPSYPPDFRVEKLSGGEQLERLRKTDLAEAVIRNATVADVNWIAR